MILSTEEIKAVLDAAAEIAKDDNQGHWLVLKNIDYAHAEAVMPANLERVQHMLAMSAETGAIIHPHPAVQWFFNLFSWSK